jgi:hypothetical protein
MARVRARLIVNALATVRAHNATPTAMHALLTRLLLLLYYYYCNVVVVNILLIVATMANVSERLLRQARHAKTA